MATVYDVADYILGSCGPMSAMKLQKLVYYAQAWSLVWDEQPLFPDDFEAWANGPVVRSLYDLHRGQFRVSPYFLAAIPSSYHRNNAKPLIGYCPFMATRIPNGSAI